jgi:sugar lactone lactonase YvrE
VGARNARNKLCFKTPNQRKNPVNNAMKSILSIFALAALAFFPARAPADTLYVTGGDSLFQFNTSAGAGSRTTITNFISSGTTAVTVDCHGNVFLATWGNFDTDFGDIYEITTNGVLLTIATGLNGPDSLAVDSRGNLFEGEETNLNEFINTNGTLASTPVPIGNGFAIDSLPSGLAFDGGGNLFVAEWEGIYEFTNSAGDLSTNATLFYPGGGLCLAFDSSGNLFVGTGGEAGYPGLEFVNNAGMLSSTPSYFPGINAEQMAFDSHDNLFVQDNTGNFIFEFTNSGAGLASLPATFVTGLDASGLAFLPVASAPKLYMAGDDSIYTFALTAGGGSQSTIASGLGYKPGPMAVDSHGNLFEWDGNSTIYETPRNGASIAFVSGIEHVKGMAFDPNGNLFVADITAGINGIDEFTNSAGALTTNSILFAGGLDSLDAMAFDRRGNLYVATGGMGAVWEFVRMGGTLCATPSQILYGVQGFPNSLAFDANDDLLVGYAGGELEMGNGDGILEYLNNNSAAWYNGGVLSSAPIALAGGNVAGLACDTGGNVFEVNGDNGNIYEFSSDTGVLSSTPTLYAGGLDAGCVAINPGFQASVSAAPPNLYVSDNLNNRIYSFNTTNGATSRGLLGDRYYWTGYDMTFDSHGNLFVSQAGSGVKGVLELTNNAGILSSNAISLELFSEQSAGGGLVFDGFGNLYVADVNNYDIDKFTNSGVVGTWGSVDQDPFVGGAVVSFSLAIDSRGNLFSANYGFNDSGGWGYVSEYGNLNSPVPWGQTMLEFGDYGLAVRGMAFDGQGNLFVGEIDWYDSPTAVGYIYEFTNTPAGLSTNGTLFAGGLGDVGSLAFDAGGNLFEADGSSGNLNEFISTEGILSSTPVTFATGLGNAAALAISIAPPVPQLNIIVYNYPNDYGTVAMAFWPASATGYMLQTNSSLALPGWANYGGSVNSFLGTNYVTISPAAGNLFFRLQHP